MKTAHIHTLPLENEPALRIAACPGGVSIVRDAVSRCHTLVLAVGPDLESAWESFKESRDSIPADPADLDAMWAAWDAFLARPDFIDIVA